MDASGNGLGWDPALTDARPAEDRELAWAAAAELTTKPGAWYQHLAGLRVVRRPHVIDPEVLAADEERVEAFFRARGWPDASAAVEVRPRREGVEDVLFVVTPGEARLPKPPPETPAPLEPGWTVKPLASAFGRGTLLSIYGGAHADWLGRGTSAAVLHGEVGLRAFGNPFLKPRFDGNAGMWSDLRAEWSRGIGGDFRVFGAVRGRSDLWPSLSEAEPSLGVGLRWGPVAHVTAAAELAGGMWTSWAWTGQRDGYTPWFDGPPLWSGQRLFVPHYEYGRLNLSLTVDSTDAQVLPRRGVRVDMETTPLGWAAGAPFFRGQLDARGFVPLGSHRWIAGLRGLVGGLDWEDPEHRGLLGERFFLGGPNMRAWGRRRVMVPDYAGGKTDLRPGGNLVTYANAELRWHVHRDLALAAFADTGRVWERWSDVGLNRLLSDVGLSVSVPSPAGSIRLDAALRLSRQPTDGPNPLAFQLWINQPW